MPAGFRVEGAAQLSVLAKQLRVANPMLRREMMTALRAAVQPVVTDARATAGQVSPKVAATVGTQIRTGGRTASVAVRSAAGKMPAGHEPLPRLLEHGGTPGSFRHPVFGNTSNWVEQPAHPFLKPAVDRHRPEIEAALAGVLTRISGFLTHG